MMIVFKHDKNGAFICGDTTSRMTSYAYPTSANAQQARKAPMAIAADMLAGQTRQAGRMWEADYDYRNWTMLES